MDLVSKINVYILLVHYRYFMQHNCSLLRTSLHDDDKTWFSHSYWNNLDVNIFFLSLN